MSIIELHFVWHMADVVDDYDRGVAVLRRLNNAPLEHVGIAPTISIAGFDQPATRVLPLLEFVIGHFARRESVLLHHRIKDEAGE